MKQTKLLLATLLIVAATFFACQKELSTDPGDTSLTNLTFTPNISTSIHGRIVDELNAPLQGVSVKAGGTTVVTNINGEFELNNVNVYDQAAFVQATKQGYFNGSRTIVANQGTVHSVEIKMIPNQSMGTIDMAAGGTVTLANGTAVSLPASSVVVATSNTPYTGNVSVSLAWIDPTSDFLENEMPGDLRGIDAANAQMGLESFGMIAVELRGASGEKLQVAAGKKAAVKFFLPASIVASAPAEIALWSFNETTGLWKQEGTATKAGNFYNAEVSHFSFWNCDAPFPLVRFSATIKYANGEPVKNRSVRIKHPTRNGYTYGRTDTAGVVRGLIPANQSLRLDVMNLCNTPLHTQNIGPYSTATQISITISGNNVQAATVFGTATNCAGVPIANGIANLVTGQRSFRTAIVNGAYNFNLAICSTSQAATLVLIDTANGQQVSSTLSLTAGANNAGALSACGTSIAQFINFTVNGIAHSLLPPADSLSARYNLQSARTNVSGSSRNQGVTKNIEFQFNGNTTGSHNLTSIFVNTPGGMGSLQANTITANITEYGPAGGYVAGSFAGNITDSLVSRPIQCTFRVRRF